MGHMRNLVIHLNAMIYLVSERVNYTKLRYIKGEAKTPLTNLPNFNRYQDNTLQRTTKEFFGLLKQGIPKSSKEKKFRLLKTKPTVKIRSCKQKSVTVIFSNFCEM